MCIRAGAGAELNKNRAKEVMAFVVQPPRAICLQPPRAIRPLGKSQKNPSAPRFFRPPPLEKKSFFVSGSCAKNII